MRRLVLPVALVLGLATGCHENTFAKTMTREPPPAPRYSQIVASPTEEQLLVAINDARVAAGVAPLAWGDEIAFVAHDASDTYDVHDLAYADVRVDHAIATSPIAALDLWLNDVVQRGNLLAPGLTHVGIAVTQSGPDHVGVTAITVRVPPVVDTAQLAQRIAATIEPVEHGDKRKQADDLRFAAQAAADRLAAGVPPDDIRAVINSWVDASSTTVSRIADVESLADSSAIRKLLSDSRGAPRYGIGVSQGKDRAHGHGAVWVVIVESAAR
jgi:hypothetical protein